MVSLCLCRFSRMDTPTSSVSSSACGRSKAGRGGDEKWRGQENWRQAESSCDQTGTRRARAFFPSAMRWAVCFALSFADMRRSRWLLEVAAPPPVSPAQERANGACRQESDGAAEPRRCRVLYGVHCPRTAYALRMKAMALRAADCSPSGGCGEQQPRRLSPSSALLRSSSLAAPTSTNDTDAFLRPSFSFWRLACSARQV